MKVLILSCNTGGGHNAAGHAVQQALEAEGHEAQVLDYLRLKGAKVSDTVGGCYTELVKRTPAVFGAVYHLGLFVSRHARISPVYYANRAMVSVLEKYLMENPVDAIVMPHLYPAETITAMKRAGFPLPPTFCVATDYTCIPFWEETDCDWYFLPHADCVEECVARGMDRKKLVPLGIPVSLDFDSRGVNRSEACRVLGLDENKKHMLVAGGSMGAGKLPRLVAALLRLTGDDVQIHVICGNNEPVRKTLLRRFGQNKRLTVLAHTNQMPLYMRATDVLFTKPGGLTSSEAAACGVPTVHITPIPGCESYNRRFFVSRGMTVSASSARGQALAGVHLLQNIAQQKEMLRHQQTGLPRHAALEIARFIEAHAEVTKETAENE